MAERTLTIRIDVEGAEAARAAFERLAGSFEQAKQRLGGGSAVAADYGLALRQVGDAIVTTAARGTRSMRELGEQGARQANALDLAWRRAFSSLDDAIADTAMKGGRNFDRLRQVGLKLAQDITAAFAQVSIGSVTDSLGISPGRQGTAGGVGSSRGSLLGGLSPADFDKFVGAIDKFGASTGVFSHTYAATTSTGFAPGEFGMVTTEGALPFSLSEALGPVFAALPGIISGNVAQAALAAAGSIAGTIIGGPVGGAIGSTLGNLLGGLFGGKTSVGPTAAAEVRFGRDGFEVAGTGTDNGGSIEQARKFAEAMTGALDAIRNVTGLELSANKILNIQQNPAEGFRARIWEQVPGGEWLNNLTFDQQDFASFDEAFIAALRAGVASGDFAGVGEDVRKAIEKSTATSMKDFGADLEFAASFRQTMEFLESGLDPVHSQMAQLAKGANDFGDRFGKLTEEFREKAVAFGLATEGEVNAGLQNLLKGTLGLIEVGEPLSGLALQLETTRQNFTALKPVLEDIGHTADEAAALIAQGIEATRAKLAAQLSDSLIARHNDAVGLGVLNTLGGAVDQSRSDAQTNALLYGSDPAALGATTNVVNAIFNAQVGKALEGLGGDTRALQAVIDQFSGSTDVAEQYIAALAQQMLDVARAAEVAAQAERNRATAAAEITDRRGIADAIAHVEGDSTLRATSGWDLLTLSGITDLAVGVPAVKEMGVALEGLNADFLAGTAQASDYTGVLQQIDTNYDALVAAGLDVGRVIGYVTSLYDEQTQTAAELAEQQRKQNEAAALNVDTLRRGANAIEQAIDPDYRPGSGDVLLDAGVSPETIANLDALAGAIDAFNGNVESAALLRDAGSALDAAFESGAITVDEYNDVLRYLTGSFQRAGSEAVEAADQVDALAQAIAGFQQDVNRQLTSNAAAVVQLPIQSILEQIGTGLAGALGAPLEAFLAAANVGADYYDDFIAVSGMIAQLGASGTLTPAQVTALGALIDTIAGIGDRNWQASQRVAEAAPRGPSSSEIDRQHREAEERERRRVDINSDIRIRGLEAEGRTLEAQLLRADLAGDALVAEAQRVGADLAALNQVLDAERQAIIDGYMRRAQDANDGLAVRAMRAQGRDLDAQLLEFDQRAARDKAEYAALAAQLEAIGQVGPDLGLLNEVLAAERQSIIDSFEDVGDAVEDVLKRVIDDLRGYVEGLSFGASSPLSPEQRLAEAQAVFGSTIARARERDEEAIAALPKVAERLLEEARSFYASGGAFTTLFELTRQQLQSVLGVLGSPSVLPGFAAGGVAAPGWAMVGERGPELVRFGAPARVYPADASRRLDAAAAGDGGDLRRALDALTERLDALLRLQAAGAELSLDELRAMRGGIEELRRKASLAAAA